MTNRMSGVQVSLTALAIAATIYPAVVFAACPISQRGPANRQLAAVPIDRQHAEAQMQVAGAPIDQPQAAAQAQAAGAASDQQRTSGEMKIAGAPGDQPAEPQMQAAGANDDCP